MESVDFLLLEILSWSSVNDICNVTLVCKEWRNVGDSDELWKRFCTHLWTNKANVKPGTVFPGVRLDQAGVGTLSVKELKQLLAHQDIPYRHYIEKKEFREAVGALQALGTGPRVSRKWKELINSKWKFYFKQQLNQRIDMDEMFCSVAEFKKDGSFTMNPSPMPNGDGKLYLWDTTIVETEGRSSVNQAFLSVPEGEAEVGEWGEYPAMEQGMEEYFETYYSQNNPE